MADHASATSAARRVAAFGLPTRIGSDGPIAMSPSTWPVLLRTLKREKLTGLAVACMEAGGLVVDDGQSTDLLKVHRSAMLGALGIERMLLKTQAAFAPAEIPFVVLKGPAVAHASYPDPSWRPFGDLDLLVRSEDWRSACAVLGGLGLRRELPEPRAGFDVRFGKAAVFRGEDGLEVDLHRTLVVGPYGVWVDVRELFLRTEPFKLGDVGLFRFEPTAALLHACVHASLGQSPPLLLPLRDVAQLSFGDGVDWAQLWVWSRRWKLAAVLQHAFRSASKSLRVELPPDTQRFVATVPARRETRALRAYTTHRTRGGTARSLLRAIPGSRAKLAYAKGMLVPRREFLTARMGRRKPSYLRRWLIPVRWLAGGRSRT